MKFKFLLSTALITTLVACGGAEERKAVYMEKAKASIEAGDFDKARIELKNVLQIDPKDGEAYYQLGSVYEKQKDYRKAYSNYLKAEELSPDLLANQAKLGTIYLVFMNDVNKAQEKVDLILAKDSKNTEGLLLKVSILLKNNEKDEALRIAKSVAENDPSDVVAAIFLGTLYYKNKYYEEAIDVLNTALKSNKNNKQLSSLLALVLVNKKEYVRAEEIYKKLLDSDKDSHAVYTQLAKFYIQINEKEKAENILRDSVDNDPKDAKRYYDLIRYISDEKGNEEAIRELRAFIDSNKSMSLLRLALAEYYYLNSKIDDAIDVYKQAIIDFPDEETAILSQNALTLIYIQKNKIDEATMHNESAFEKSPGDPKVNFLRAQLALNDKNVEKAIISLRVVVRETPENIHAYLLLANIYHEEGDKEQANRTLNSAYENNMTNADALLKLANVYLNRDINQAEKIIDNYNTIKGADYDGLSIKASILNQNKQYSEAYKIAETLMEIFSDKPNGYLQAVPYYSEQNDLQKAVAILEKGYLSTKDNRKLLLVLTTLQMQNSKFDIVEKRIKAEISAAPNDLELKVLLAKVFMLSDKISLAETSLNEIIGINPGLEEPYLLFSHIHQRNKDLDAVKSILVRGVANVPSSTKIPLELAEIYERDGEYDKAIDVYYNYNQSKPDNLIVINNMASLLSTHVDGKAGLELAAELIKKLEGTDQAAFLDTVGWVYYKLGDAEKAIENLKQAVDKNPDVNVFNYHLGMAYKLANDKAQAKIHLEKSLANKKDFVEKSAAEEALKNL